MTDKTEKQFKARAIGTENVKKSIAILEYYGRVTNELNNLKTMVEKCLKIEFLDIEDFLDFLKSDARKWITAKYIEIHKIAVPGFDVNKMLEAGFGEMQGLDAVLEQEKKLAAELAKDAEGFYYPVDELWDPEQRKFDLTTGFIEAESNHCVRFTQSEEQNQVVEILEQVCNGLNKLAELNLLRPQHGYMELNYLEDWIDINGSPMLYKDGATDNATMPFTVSPYVFHRHRMDRFRIKGLPESKYRKKETLLNAINLVR